MVDGAALFQRFIHSQYKKTNKPTRHSIPTRFCLAQAYPAVNVLTVKLAKKKKNTPNYQNMFFFLTLKAAKLYICIQPSYVRSDAVLLYILTITLQHDDVKTLRIESRSLTVFRDRALAEEEENATGGGSTCAEEDKMSIRELIPNPEFSSFPVKEFCVLV